MQWHTLPGSAPLENPDTFEEQALKETHLWISYVPPRYRSSYFLHIWERVTRRLLRVHVERDAGRRRVPVV